ASQRIGSGVLIDDYIFMVNENGQAQCIDWQSGKIRWTDKLWDKPGGSQGTWSSIVHAGDRLYLVNMEGTTYVLAAKPKLEILAKNVLSKSEMTRASIAISDGELFIRTYQRLWCIGKKK